MTILMPGTPLERAVKVASQRLQSEFDDRIKAREAQLTETYERQLSDERAFGNVGRKVMRGLKDKGVNLPSIPTPGTDQICARYARTGKDFDTLMDAVKNDVMLKSEWDRFCMMLRLAQEDNTDGE